MGCNDFPQVLAKAIKVFFSCVVCYNAIADTPAAFDLVMAQFWV